MRSWTLSLFCPFSGAPASAWGLRLLRENALEEGGPGPSDPLQRPAPASVTLEPGGLGLRDTGVRWGLWQAEPHPGNTGASYGSKSTWALIPWWWGWRKLIKNANFQAFPRPARLPTQRPVASSPGDSCTQTGEHHAQGTTEVGKPSYQEPSVPPVPVTVCPSDWESAFPVTSLSLSLRSLLPSCLHCSHVPRSF